MRHILRWLFLAAWLLPACRDVLGIHASDIDPRAQKDAGSTRRRDAGQRDDASMLDTGTAMLDLPDSGAHPDAGEPAAGGGGEPGAAGAGAGGSAGTTDCHECTQDATRCSSQMQLQHCMLMDGCYRWGVATDCGSHQRCSEQQQSARCECLEPPAACADGAGAYCDDSTHLGTCLGDEDGCIYAAETLSCPTGKPCIGDHPEASCSCASPPSECVGVTGGVCRSTSERITCERNVEGCLSIAQTAQCSNNLPCSGAPGAADCRCPPAPAACANVTNGNLCQSDTSYVTCRSDVDGCVSASPATCTPTKPCRGSAGAAACTCLNPPSAAQCPAGMARGNRCSGTQLYSCGVSSEGCATFNQADCTSIGDCVDSYPNARCAVVTGACTGKAKGTCWIGSEIAEDTGGATGYAKAQSFLAPDTTISRVDVYVPQAITKAWGLHIVTGLPVRDPAIERGVVLASDLAAKSLGSASLPSSNAGWVSFTFSPALSVRTNQPYFIFNAGDPTSDPATSPRNWSESTPGALPGPYADGTAWILVYNWSDNNNYRETMERHSDNAFRVWP